MLTAEQKELITALKQKDTNKVEELAKKGINSSTINYHRCTTVLDFIVSHEDLAILKYLVEKEGKDIVNKVDRYGETVLHTAISCNRREIIEYLLENGANINKMREEKKLSALCNAARYCDISMVKSLLEQSSPETVENIDEIRDCWEKTMLHHAAKGDNIEVVKYLVEEKRANVNAVDRNRMSVLHDSVKSMKVMRYLIEERRADINTINKDGMSILHNAVANGSMEAIRYLIEEKKIDVNVRSKRRSTPLHLAISAVNEDCVERVQYLIEKGADIKAVNKYGKTPFGEVMKEPDTAFTDIKLTSTSQGVAP